MPDDTNPIERLEEVDSLRAEADEIEAEAIAEIRESIEQEAGENFGVSVEHEPRFGGVSVRLRPKRLLGDVELPSDEWNVQLFSRLEYRIYHDDHEALVVNEQADKEDRQRLRTLKQLIDDIEQEHEDGAPVDEVVETAGEIGMPREKTKEEIDKLRRKGEVYEPKTDHLRTT